MCHNDLAFMPQLEKKQEPQLEMPEQRNHREVASQLLHLKKKEKKKKKKKKHPRDGCSHLERYYKD